MARQPASAPQKTSRQAGRQEARRASRAGQPAVPAAPPVDPVRQALDSLQIRIAACVMAGSMVLWMLLQWLGARMGWEARWAFLIDFAAIAALVWSLAVTWRIWRRRKA